MRRPVAATDLSRLSRQGRTSAGEPEFVRRERLQKERPQGFQRRVRLTRPGAFSAALAKKPQLRSERFALHIHPGAGGNGSAGSAGTGVQRDGWRLGLVVPKRHEASAVRRNTIKRIWREAYRKQRATFGGNGQSIVVRLLKPFVAGSDEIGLEAVKRLCRNDAELLLRQLAARL